MALGRGLGDILEEMGRVYEQELDSSGALDDRNLDEICEIDVNSIDPNPYQPRKYFDEERLFELAESIKSHGLLQPIVVIPAGDRYIVVAGERRLRAHKLANFNTIRAIVADANLDEMRLRELALIENIQREDLHPVELAKSYKELIDVHGITHEELAKIVHKSRSQITNTLRLLSLDDYTLSMLSQDKITQGHAKILVTLDRDDRKKAVDTIIGRRLSVRESEKLVQDLKNGSRGIDKSFKSRGLSEYKLSKDDKIMLKELLSDFKYKIKNSSIEFKFDNRDGYDKFVTLIKNSLK